MYFGYSSSQRNTSTFLVENESLLLSTGKHIVLTTSGQQKAVGYTYDQIREVLCDFKQQQQQAQQNEKDKISSDRLHQWIDFQGLDERELNDICNLVGIHYLTKKDIINQGTREKCEFFQNHIFIVVNEIHYEEGSNNLVSGYHKHSTACRREDHSEIHSALPEKRARSHGQTTAKADTLSEAT
ncbi:putative CorA family magnesium ion transporter [Heterostelium album PN500]|uniref:Putative CorA family magnesium ion transporter n=1 Tax=Heterostelium pallidum (strain ATCC 26659 / Pp 5 / PN500) TaxID=670386 RepID=D3BBM8_HETP5|nr:putative CorA family magnesium ion transporter [Heterostelium album PN500]EFA81061.1 putative CorA family magnesium ion transporter [Heterostelium album PN500]|eukprot:XP_020433179.1 putative CorA family magnesium ion transporter [Heterostelium album PN500]